jgi:hypothetical protein
MPEVNKLLERLPDKDPAPQTNVVKSFDRSKLLPMQNEGR